MRVYVPATLSLLRTWHESGKVDVRSALAVTAALRASYGTDDDEELEYAALSAAARASLRLLVSDRAAPPRRVVVALDAPGAVVDDVSGQATVRLPELPGVDAVAAVHVDGEEAQDTVAAAVAALADRPADEETARAVEAVEDIELAWFATQEIPDLVR